MSTNVRLEFDDETQMLIATDGESTRYKWTYSDFEKYLNESITPSMYHFMAGYVYDNMTKNELCEIEASSGGIEEEAVNAYFELPALERQEMHDQELVNLQAEFKCSEEKKIAAIDWILEDVCPFDPTSPIYVEMCQFVQGLADKYNLKGQRLKQEIHEEEQWRGGWEEDMVTDPKYDYGDEV